jgi:hypothetical protein
MDQSTNSQSKGKQPAADPSTDSKGHVLITLPDRTAPSGTRTLRARPPGDGTPAVASGSGSASGNGPVISGRVTKTRGKGRKKERQSREKKEPILIQDDMTPEEIEAAKKTNYQIRNSESAAKSRIRRSMTLIELHESVLKYEDDRKLLHDLVEACRARL